MASQQLRVIVDDNAGDIVYSGGQWTLSTLVQWYQATSNFPAFITPTVFGSLTLSFEGTSAAFIGNTPTAGFSQTATVSIDSGAASNITYPSAPPAYVQWYQSPVLADGKHTIKVDHLAGTAVDMILVTVGPNTPLAGKKVFVDNNDPAIQYMGSWTENKNTFNAGTLPDGFPVGNSTQRSTTPGDSMTFRFSGTSISIYGIFTWTNVGGISATFALDGKSQASTFPVTASSPQHLSSDGDATNFLFYEQDALSPGAHTLTVNITDLENQAFNLDYIVYSPSFSTLATMPNLTSGATTPSSSSITGALPGSSTSKATGTGADSGGAVQTGDPNNQAQGGSKGSPIGAIIGGALGGLALLVFAVLLLVYLRRRRENANESPVVQQRLYPGNDVTPQMSDLPRTPGFTHSTSASRENITPFTMSSLPGSPGFPLVSDSKRSRMDQEHAQRDAAPSPFAGSGARSNASSHDVSHQRNASSTLGSPPNTASAYAEDELEYVGDPVPPAYDALSTHRASTLSPVRR